MSTFDDLVFQARKDLLRRRIIFNKGRRPGMFLDPDEYRYDDNDKLIRWQEYGDQSSEYGWQIDHITPKSLGGSDRLENLRPLNAYDNARHGGLLGALLRGGHGLGQQPQNALWRYTEGRRGLAGTLLDPTDPPTLADGRLTGLFGRHPLRPNKP